MSVESGSTSKRLTTKDEMEYEFIQSGEKQRLQEIMTKRLKETGWVSKVEGLCKDYIERKVIFYTSLTFGTCLIGCMGTRKRNVVKSGVALFNSKY